MATAKHVGLHYRLVDIFVEKSKLKKLIRHPLFKVAMYCLRLRVAVRYVQNKNGDVILLYKTRFKYDVSW